VLAMAQAAGCKSARIIGGAEAGAAGVKIV